MNPDRAGMSMNPYERYVAWCQAVGYKAVLSEEQYERLVSGVTGMVIDQERWGGRLRGKGRVR